MSFHVYLDTVVSVAHMVYSEVGGVKIMHLQLMKLELTPKMPRLYVLKVG